MLPKPCKFLCLSLLGCGLLLAGPAFALSPLTTPADSLKVLRAEALENRLRGMNDQALDAYERAVDIARREFGENSTYVADIYFDMGSIALQASKFERAENYLNSAVKVNPYSVAARVKLAELLRVRGRPEDAARQAQQALKKHPDSLEARHQLAMSYLEMNELNKANEEFAHFDALLKGKNAPPPRSLGTVPPPQPAGEAKPLAGLLAPIKAPAKTEPEAKPKPETAPKTQPEKKPAPEAKPKVGPAPKPKAEEKPKPKPKPKAEAKPKLEAKPKVEPGAEPKPQVKPVAKPVELKAKPARNRLVPPPPPLVPAFPGGMIPPPPPGGYGLTTGNPNYRLNTQVQIKPKEKPKEPPKEQPPEEKPAQSGSGGAAPDDDFLLEWADKGGKKKGK